MPTVSVGLVDICLPDYFLGSDRVVLAVSIDGATTHAELLEGLLDDARRTDDERLEGVSDEQLKAACRAAFVRVSDMNSIVRPDLDVVDEDDGGDMVYAYFTVTVEDGEQEDDNSAW